MREDYRIDGRSAEFSKSWTRVYDGQHLVQDACVEEELVVEQRTDNHVGVSMAQRNLPHPKVTCYVVCKDAGKCC